MARFMVTGGAGFLGINLVRYLLDKGHDVTSLDMIEFDYPDCMDKIRIVTGDIRDKAKVAEATEGADIVVHCAAALPLYSEEDILTTDIDGSRNVIDEAHRQGIERFVHISSTAVYGIPDHHPLYEDDKLDGVGPYGVAKVEAENLQDIAVRLGPGCEVVADFSIAPSGQVTQGRGADEPGPDPFRGR